MCSFRNMNADPRGIKSGTCLDDNCDCTLYEYEEMWMCLKISHFRDRISLIKWQVIWCEHKISSCMMNLVVLILLDFWFIYLSYYIRSAATIFYDPGLWKAKWFKKSLFSRVCPCFYKSPVFGGFFFFFVKNNEC